MFFVAARLERRSRVVVLPSSWVERQNNVKTVVAGDRREPLAEEVGRNWYIRVPDAQCAEAARWTQERLAFWRLLQETWAEYFAADESWSEQPPGKGPPRWSQMAKVEERHFAKVEQDSKVRVQAKQEIHQIIDADSAC